MSTALACLIGLAAGAVSVAAYGWSQQPPPPPTQQPPATQQQQPPVFRAGVRIVRVDVSVTGKGDRPVADLQLADFEVQEDGVPQHVESAQFVRLDGQRVSGDEGSLDIRSPEHAMAEAARDDVRLFALFLDDYHIDKSPEITLPLRRALTGFVDRLAPTDLVAIMDPLTTLSALRFTRSKPDLLEVIRKFEGRQGEIFPIKSVMEEAQLARGDMRRVRAEVTFSALNALVVRLGGLREGRKTVLFVSQGPPVLLGLSEGNLQEDVREILQSASRGNVTIHSLDPRGLGGPPRAGATDTLYQLAGETGGRIIINTNSLTDGLKRIVNDASAYYLLGYTPTRTEDDGKFHKINVNVKRPGTKVVARRGYWAPSRKEMEAAAAAASKPEVPGVVRALEKLVEPKTRHAVQIWIGLSERADKRAQVTVTWAPSEPASGTPVAGVDVEVLGGADGTLVEPRRTMAGGAPSGMVRTQEVFTLDPGDVSLRFTARAADRSEIDRWAQAITVPDLRFQPLVLATPRLYRAVSLSDVRAIQAAAEPVPEASNAFHRGDRVFMDVQYYTAQADAAPEMSLHLLSADGRELVPLQLPPLAGGKARLELPVRNLGQGTYILRLRARLGDARVEQLVAIRIVP